MYVFILLKNTYFRNLKWENSLKTHIDRRKIQKWKKMKRLQMMFTILNEYYLLRLLFMEKEPEKKVDCRFFAVEVHFGIHIQIRVTKYTVYYYYYQRIPELMMWWLVAFEMEKFIWTHMWLRSTKHQAPSNKWKLFKILIRSESRANNVKASHIHHYDTYRLLAWKNANTKMISFQKWWEEEEEESQLYY